MTTTYVIDTDNNVTLLGPKDTEINGEQFSSEADLLALAEKWPDGRLLEVRNSIPGLEPATKISNTKKVVNLVFRTINQLMAPAAASTAKPKKAKAKVAKATTKEPKAAKPAKPAKPAKQSKSTKTKTKTEKPAHADSKKAMVLGMMQRKGGATLEEICKVTGWQKHTVRGMVATLPKSGVKAESFKNGQGQRTYAIR